MLRQLASVGKALAEAHDTREGVNDREAAFTWTSDQQPAIIGAEIDRAISVAMRLSSLREALVRWPALGLKFLPQGRRTGDTLRHYTPVSVLHRPTWAADLALF